MDMSSFYPFYPFLHRMREHNGLITEFLPQCVNRLVELMLAVALFGYPRRHQTAKAARTTDFPAVDWQP